MTTWREEDLAAARDARDLEVTERLDELSSLAAHLSAATARFLELVWSLRELAHPSDYASFVAYRFGVTRPEARELLRVAEALQELPATRGAFARGELTFTKVRALTRVATASSEEGLLELAGALTAAQLERALRAFRRLTAEEARVTHELEYVRYHFDEHGSLILHARLAAEDGTVLMMALDAARERILERRRVERAHANAAEPGGADADPAAVEPPDPRPASVEALLELAGNALGEPGAREPGAREQGVREQGVREQGVREQGVRERRAAARLVVHVDAEALLRTNDDDGDANPDGVDAGGRAELQDGSVISPETARRLGCDAEIVTQVERDGLPLSVGRRRRTVPPALRRLLEARDDTTCRFPGCERRRHLQAHHLHHWAHGGETSLDNLVLLCFHHHRLVHEGGTTIENDGSGPLRFRNRFGLVWDTVPSRPPPGHADAVPAGNAGAGIEIDPDTLLHGLGRRQDLRRTVAAVSSIVAPRDAAAAA